MFGMSSTEFWEYDPQLYWSYRTFYLNKIEQDMETLEYGSWLNGNMNCIAVSTSLCNAFNDKKIEYPKYSDVKNVEIQEEDTPLTKKEAELKMHEEFNAWARY